MTKDDVLKVHSDVFYAALTSQNYAALEELYSDDYMLVRPDGSVLNKQEVLQDLRSNGLRFHSIDPRQLVARIYGSVGMVTGESRTVTSRNGWRAAHTFDSSRSICAWAIRSGLFIFKVPF